MAATTQCRPVALHPNPLTIRITLTTLLQYREEARRTLYRLRGELLAARNDHGHWEGFLSGSSLSTATAISALSTICIQQAQQDTQENQQLQNLIVRGIRYLATQQNDDGGFGDTDRSHSNIATSYLVLAASELSRQATGRSLDSSQISRLNDYIKGADQLDGLRRRYGKDKTFVVPILCNMAIAGLVDWKDVLALPFEAAAFPQSMYRFLRVPVVSYAIPALVAIGQAKHFHRPHWFVPLRIARASVVDRTRNVLLKMQPDSGGYLEATPLTSFVLMSLASIGQHNHAVCRNGLRFLIDSVRDDGSWPIDTNLATWVTSLSIGALTADPEDDGGWITDDLLDWLLSCQHRKRHPFTGAEPGGWGWTDLSGAVPDGDDTPAAILALESMQQTRPAFQADERIATAKNLGRQWLAKLQNRNGGMPTFCRGWGKLPFDRSSVDLTAHAIRSWAGDREKNRPGPTCAAIQFIQGQQQADGSWLPLWFGNQDRPDEDNPIYGTSKVLLASEEILLSDFDPIKSISMLKRGVIYLIDHQNSDGGWGGGKSAASIYGLSAGNGITSTIEETALAIEALAEYRLSILKIGEYQNGMIQTTGENASKRPHLDITDDTTQAIDAVILSGLKWLCDGIEDRLHETSFPIGFYFAKLWYHERLYPLIYSTAAIGRYLSLVSHLPSPPRASSC